MGLCDESISKLLEFRGLVKGQQSATQSARIGGRQRRREWYAWASEMQRPSCARKKALRVTSFEVSGLRPA